MKLLWDKICEAVMIRVVTICILMLLGSYSSILFAQSEFDYDYSPFFRYLIPQVNDNRARSMGNTEILSTSGSNACFSNPALLTNLKGFTVAWALRGIYGHEETEIDKGLMTHSSYESYSNSVDSPGECGTNLISMAATISKMKWIDKMVLGIGWQKLYDNSIQRDSEIDIRNGDEFYTLSVDDSRNDGLKFWCPSLGIKVNKFLSLGITANISANSKFDQEVVKELYCTYESSDDIPRPIRDYSENRIIYKVSGDFYSFGMRIDLGKVQIGGLYRTELDCDLQYQTQDSYYPNDEIEVDYQEIIPAIWGIAIAYHPNDRLTLTGEIQNRTFDAYQTHLDNGIAKRFGLEAKANDNLKVRFGYYREPVFIFDYGKTKPKELKGLTCGFGYQINGFNVDLYLDYAGYKFKSKQNYSIYDVPDYLGSKGRLIQTGCSLSYTFEK